MIRPLTADDIPKIPRLLATDQGEHAQPSQQMQAVVEHLLPRLLIHTPHADPEIQGLVSEESDGRLSGMIGRIARRMEFRGRPIRAGVTFELFVDPAQRTKMLGVKLLKAAMAGPQDLLFSDIANEKSRKIWTGLGGSTAAWYGLSWTKVLQPTQFALGMIGRQPLRALASAAWPFAGLTDRLLRRYLSLTQLNPEPNADSEPLTPDSFLELFPQFSAGNDLRPIYDRETLDWIWPRLDFLYPAGPSEQRLVKTPGGEPLGWYVYQMTDTRLARVSQLVATTKTVGIVLDHLLHRAAQRGAVAITGRVIPRKLQAFLDRDCLIRRRSTHTLIHARDTELTNAFATGQAFVSLFESEGPVQIWNNPQLALARLRSEHTPTMPTRSEIITVETKRREVAEQASRILEH